MTDRFLQWLRGLIASGDVHPFYVTPEWRALSSKVLDMDKECLIHKARGHFAPAELVHHVNHVKDHPELALDLYYTDAKGQRQRNLISVCRECHETVCHPERMHRKKRQGFTTQERWD